MMNDYGTLQESNSRYVLKFERLFALSPEEVFSIITNSEYFLQW